MSEKKEVTSVSARERGGSVKYNHCTIFCGMLYAKEFATKRACLGIADSSGVGVAVLDLAPQLHAYTLPGVHPSYTKLTTRSIYSKSRCGVWCRVMWRVV